MNCYRWAPRRESATSAYRRAPLSINVHYFQLTLLNWTWRIYESNSDQSQCHRTIAGRATIALRLIGGQNQWPSTGSMGAIQRYTDTELQRYRYRYRPGELGDIGAEITITHRCIAASLIVYRRRGSWWKNCSGGKKATKVQNAMNHIFVPIKHDPM